VLRAFFYYHQTSLIVAQRFEKPTKSRPTLKKPSAAWRGRAIRAIAPSILANGCPRQGHRRPPPRFYAEGAGRPAPSPLARRLMPSPSRAAGGPRKGSAPRRRAVKHVPYGAPGAEIRPATQTRRRYIAARIKLLPHILSFILTLCCRAAAELFITFCDRASSRSAFCMPVSLLWSIIILYF
jgi:hypothetical protein